MRAGDGCRVEEAGRMLDGSVAVAGSPVCDRSVGSAAGSGRAHGADFVVEIADGLREDLRVEADRPRVVVERAAEEATAVGGLLGTDLGEVEFASIARSGRGAVVDVPGTEEDLDDAAACRLGDAEGAGEGTTGDARMLTEDDERDVLVVAQSLGLEDLLRPPIEGAHEIVEFECQVHISKLST